MVVLDDVLVHEVVRGRTGQLVVRVDPGIVGQPEVTGGAVDQEDML